MSIHEDTVQGLQEALDYVRGDKTKGRSKYLFAPSDTHKDDQILFQKIINLSEPCKRKAIQYIDELPEASVQ